MRVRRLMLCLLLAVTLLTVFSLGKEPVRETFPQDEFTVREEMVPMRDGVNLYTLILIPKDASEPLPILL